MTHDPKQTEQPFEPRPARIRPNAGAWNPLVDMIDVFPGHRGESRAGTLGLFDAPVGIRFAASVWPPATMPCTGPGRS